jgi:hypothetical protein
LTSSSKTLAPIGVGTGGYVQRTDWGKDKWDGKRYGWFAAGSFLVSALIFTTLIWPFKFDRATDPRLGSDFVGHLIAFALIAGSALAVAGAWALYDPDSRRTRTLLICLVLPVGLVVWWVGWLRTDHEAQADMFSVFNDYTPLIKNGDLLGDPYIRSGDASGATVCSDGPTVTIQKTTSETKFCTWVRRESGGARLDAGYTTIHPHTPKDPGAEISGSADVTVACFGRTPADLRAVRLLDKRCILQPNTALGELATRLPYNPSTTAIEP